MESHASSTDAELSARVRAGDRDAFGELWRRHAESASAVARQYGGIADPDDIVQEASRKVFDAIIRGGGPFGAFRPYMNQTVRNVAVSMSRQRTPDPIGDVHDLAERGSATEIADYADGALERMITVRAFKALPQRWQTALWYTYVEGMASDEAADHLGLSRNAAAALIIRAREGLRREWLKAHVSDQSLPVSCRWVVQQLPAMERDSLTERQRAKVTEHLAGCTRCSIIAAEINDLAARLPIVLLPLVVAGLDVLGGNVADLIAYPPTAKGEPPPPQQAPRRSDSAPRSLNPSKFGATAVGRVWLMAAAVVGGVAAIALAVSLATDDPPPTAVPDLVGAQALATPDEDADRNTRKAPPAVVVTPGDEASSAAPTDEDTETDEPAQSAPGPRNSAAPDATAADVAPDSATQEADVLAPELPSGAEAPTPSPVVTVPDGGLRPTEPDAPVAVAEPVVLTWPNANLKWMKDFAFSGTGTAGSFVQLIQPDGTPVGETRVLADGTWALTPSSLVWTANTPLAVLARQLDGVGGASGAVNVGSFTFDMPLVTGVDAGAGATPAAIRVSGTNGQNVEVVTENGTRVLASRPIGAGSVRLTLPDLGTGTHRVLVRYVDPASNSRGASILTSVVVR